MYVCMYRTLDKGFTSSDDKSADGEFCSLPDMSVCLSMWLANNYISMLVISCVVVIERCSSIHKLVRVFVEINARLTLASDLAFFFLFPATVV